MEWVCGVGLVLLGLAVALRRGMTRAMEDELERGFGTVFERRA